MIYLSKRLFSSYANKKGQWWGRGGDQMARGNEHLLAQVVVSKYHLPIKETTNPWKSG